METSDNFDPNVCGSYSALSGQQPGCSCRPINSAHALSLKHTLVHTTQSPVQCLARTGVVKWKISEAIPTLFQLSRTWAWTKRAPLV